MRNRMRKFTGMVWFTLLVMPLTSVAFGHPFHISLAEMEYNEATGKIEVSLKLHGVDLEEALRRATGRQIDLEQSECDKLIGAYLARHFYLLNQEQLLLLEEGKTTEPAAKRSTIKLVGKEVEPAWMWLYFEMELPTDTGNHPTAAGEQTGGDYALVNTVLLEIAQGQINTVSIRHGAQRNALRMNVKQPWGKVPRAWLEN